MIGELSTLTVHKFGAVELASGLTADDIALYSGSNYGLAAFGTQDMEERSAPTCLIFPKAARPSSNRFEFGGRFFCTYVDAGVLTAYLEQGGNGWTVRASASANCGACGPLSVADTGLVPWVCSSNCKNPDSWRLRLVVTLTLNSGWWVGYDDRKCVGSLLSGPLG